MATKKASSFIKKVEEVIHGLAPSQPFEVSRTQGYILGIFWRALSLYKSVRLLIENKLPEEALILSRSLFTESLWLQELEVNVEQRNALIIGWANQSIIDMENLLHEGERAGFIKNSPSELEVLDKRRRELIEYGERNGVKRLMSFMAEKDGAKKHGREDDYWTFVFAHKMVHGCDAASIYRREIVDEETIGFLGETAKPEVVLATAHFSTKSILMIAKSTAIILGWETMRIESLLREMDDALEIN